jgi:fructose/tagatose bisphosphate aldolase
VGLGSAGKEVLFAIFSLVPDAEPLKATVEGAPAENFCTTPEDMLEVARRLGAVKGARFLLAATFGNVHEVYKPGHVQLKPSTLKDGQASVLLWWHTGALLDGQNPNFMSVLPCIQAFRGSEESRLIAATSAR